MENMDTQLKKWGRKTWFTGISKYFQVYVNHGSRWTYFRALFDLE